MARFIRRRARQQAHWTQTRRLRLESLERRQLLTATIGTEAASLPGIAGPFLLTPAHELAEIESHDDEDAHQHQDFEFALPGVGESAGAMNTGDGSIGAVGLIPSALYDPDNLPLSPAGLPELSSLPGASTAVYIDFDGWTTFDSFDVDGNPDTFNEAEQQRIWETWRQVAAYLSPFDANVTTVAPDFANVPTNYELVSNSVSGGYSYLRFPSSRPYGFNTSGNAPNRSSGILHEIGHNYGLRHQGDFDGEGVKSREYSYGYGALEAPTLGVDFAGRMHRMFIGHARNASDLQDDIAHIQTRILEYVTNGGDGFRGDDHAATTTDATPLVFDGVIQVGSGIIERMDDVDSFSFTVDGTANVLVRPERSSPVDVMIEVYDSSGTLVASGDQFELFDQVVVETPVNETLTLLVRSHGDYGEIGSYEIFVQPQYAGLEFHDLVDSHNYKNGQLQDRRASATFDEASGTYSVRASAGDIWNSSDDMTFVSRTLVGDGQITSRVTANSATHAWTKAGVMIRETTDRNSKHAFVAITGSNGIAAMDRTTTGGSSTNNNTADGDRLGDYVRLTRTGDVFVSEYSTDGNAWTTLETKTIAMDAEVEIGLAYTNRSTGSAHVAEFEDLEIIGERFRTEDAALDQVANVLLSPEFETGLTVAWDAVANASEYEILTSVDGFNWSTAAVVAGTATAHTLQSLDQDRRYFVVVHALDASGNRGPGSDIQFASTRPGKATGLRVNAYRTDQVVLDWHEANGEIGYRIERSDGAGGWITVAEVGASVPSYTDTDLTPDTEYTYRIVTLDNLGDAAVTSPVAGITKLPQLQGLTASTLAGGEVQLDWVNDYNHATGFSVERRVELGEWESIGSAAADAAGFTDTNPEFGHSEYRVAPLHPVVNTTPTQVVHWVNGLQARFQFDDSGDTLVDSGNAKADVLLADTTLVRDNGRDNGGARFNGNDAVMDLGQTASLVGEIDFSVGLWFRSEGSGAAVLVSQGFVGEQTGTGGATGGDAGTSRLAATSGGYSLAINDEGMLEFVVPGDFDPQSNTQTPGLELSSLRSVNDGYWHHVMATRSGTSGTLWVDGSVVDTGTADVMMLSVNETTSIGSNPGGTMLQFDGLMDDVRIVDYAMDQQEIDSTIQSANQSPTSTAQSVDLRIDEDVPESVAWDGFAVDPDGDLLVAVPAIPPENGQLEIGVDGGWMYVPNEHFFGNDSFTFIPHDTFGAAASNPITVNVIVDSVNDAPQLTQLDYLVPPGTSLFTIDWLSQAFDVEGDPLELEIQSAPSEGDVAIRDGFLDFGVTDGDFAGNTSFNVTLRDDRGASETVAVTLTTAHLVNRFKFDEITGPEVIDSVDSSGNAFAEGGSRTTGPQGAGAFSFDGTDDQVVSGVDFNQTLGGTASLLFWIRTTQTGTSNAWNSPGVTGIEQAGGSNDIQWGWIDGSGRIGVRPGTGGSKSGAAINDDQWHQVVLTRDSVSGATHVYVDGLPAGSGNGPTGFKSLAYSGIGVIADTGGTPRYLDGLLDDVRIYDAVLDAGAVADIYATSAADRPTAVDDFVETDEDVAIELDVVANDPNAFAVSIAGFAKAPLHGSVSVNTAGNVVYSPDADFHGSDEFEYWISSAGGMLAKARVNVSVDPINDPPVAVSLPDAALAENVDSETSGVLVGTLSAEDVDSAAIAYSLVVGDGDSDNDVFQIINDQVWMVAGSVVDFESKPSYSIRVQADDGDLSFSAPVTIDVTDRLEANAIELTGDSSGHSTVNGLTVDFDAAVTAEPDAFIVQRIGQVNQPVDVSVVWSMLDGRSRATLEFGGEMSDVGGSLVDGNYRLTVDADKIRHAIRGDAMDGNRDSLPGGDLSFGDSAADRFFRLFGDFDGDRDVDAHDLVEFAPAFLTVIGQPGYDARQDFDGDGDVDSRDLAQLRRRFGSSLPF